MPEPTPTPVPNVTDSVQHYAHAYALLSRGEWVDAERRFTVVIELEPNFARAGTAGDRPGSTRATAPAPSPISTRRSN